MGSTKPRNQLWLRIWMLLLSCWGTSNFPLHNLFHFFIMMKLLYIPCVLCIWHLSLWAKCISDWIWFLWQLAFPSLGAEFAHNAQLSLLWSNHSPLYLVIYMCSNTFSLSGHLLVSLKCMSRRQKTLDWCPEYLKIWEQQGRHRLNKQQWPLTGEQSMTQHFYLIKPWKSRLTIRKNLCSPLTPQNRKVRI